MTRLIITERLLGDVTILDLDGYVTCGEENVMLRTEIRRLLGEGRKRIFLNFAAVRFIDSSGVGELVSSFTAIKREKGQLKLLNLPPRVYELLEITKLLTIFDVSESDVEALSNYH